MLCEKVQENDIFGTGASLIYGPQLQLQIVSFVIENYLSIFLYVLTTEGDVRRYSMYRAEEISVHRAAACGLPKPTHLEGAVQIFLAQDQQVVNPITANTLLPSLSVQVSSLLGLSLNGGSDFKTLKLLIKLVRA